MTVRLLVDQRTPLCLMLRVRRMVLVTRDAHGLYEKFGFRPLARPAGYMELHLPDVYAQGHTKGDGDQITN